MFVLGPGTVLLNAAASITKAGAMVAMITPRSSRGRAVITFATSADNTIGDGTTAHVIGLVADRGLGTTKELLGFLGIGLGGAMPQVPMLAARSWSQVVDGLDGYKRFGVVGFAADEPMGAGAVTVTLSPIDELESSWP